LFLLEIWDGMLHQRFSWYPWLLWSRHRLFDVYGKSILYILVLDVGFESPYVYLTIQFTNSGPSSLCTILLTPPIFQPHSPSLSQHMDGSVTHIILALSTQWEKSSPSILAISTTSRWIAKSFVNSILQPITTKLNLLHTVRLCSIKYIFIVRALQGCTRGLETNIKRQKTLGWLVERLFKAPILGR